MNFTAHTSLSHLLPKYRPCSGRRGAGLGGVRGHSEEEEEEEEEDGEKDAGTAAGGSRG